MDDDPNAGAAYYLARAPQILALLDDHAQGWRPFLVAAYGEALADALGDEAREILAGLIPRLPYIGGDANTMTRHLIRSTTSLALYLAMQARGSTAAETGRILYDAVAARVAQLPPASSEAPSPAQVEEMKRQARLSHEHRFPGDWVWDYVEGDGQTFVYGYDFHECGTQKLYLAHGADDFLPYYCYLDFVTFRTPGWSFSRTMTLAESHSKCDFRFQRGGRTPVGWPPPFACHGRGQGERA